MNADTNPPRVPRFFHQARHLIGLAILLLSCQALSPAIPETATAQPAALPSPRPATFTPGSLAAANPTGPAEATALVHVSPTVEIVPVEWYFRPQSGVTVAMPAGARYIVIGDSLSYGSTLSGLTTYSDICENRWPFTQQLGLETGVLATTTLDRGDSMKTPFFSQEVRGRLESYCEPPEGDPLSSTAVPGSTTAEWLAEYLNHSVLIDSLNIPENRVVLLALGADVYADRIGKPAVDAGQYGANIGQIVEVLMAWDKVIYLGLMPHVRSGSFIETGEVNAVNAQIDQFNRQLVELYENNGFVNAEGSWIDFGTLAFEQDGRTVWFTRLQLGPDLSAVPEQELGSHIAKDGLHFLAPGYDRIGSAWSTALDAPARAEQYLENP